jgi:hypothetical protein
MDNIACHTSQVADGLRLDQQPAGNAPLLLIGLQRPLAPGLPCPGFVFVGYGWVGLGVGIDQLAVKDRRALTPHFSLMLSPAGVQADQLAVT